MKMFLTRIGFGSRAVVTGDITQIDLPSGQKSGLKNAAEVLQGVKGDFVYLLHTERCCAPRTRAAYRRSLRET